MNLRQVAMATDTPSAPTTFFKARYVILKAYKKTEYKDICNLLNLCNNIHIKISGTQKILDYYALSMHIVNEYINTTSWTSKRNYRR